MTKGGGVMSVSDKANTLRAQDHGHPPVVCYTVDCRNLCLNEEKSGTLQSKNQGGHSLNFTNPVLIEMQDFPVESIGHDIRSTQFSRGGAATP